MFDRTERAEAADGSGTDAGSKVRRYFFYDVKNTACYAAEKHRR